MSHLSNAPTPTATEIPSHIREGVRLAEKYREQIGGICAIHSQLDSRPAGELSGLSYTRTFRSGKQQPVHGLRLSFPKAEGQLDVVIRPTHNQFADFYEQYEVVRRYFPHLFHHSVVDGQNVLVLEHIHGYEVENNQVAFEKLISNPERLEELCITIFTMMDEIFQLPLSLSDINPTGGHNVIYNLKTQNFQLFDVDSIKTSDESHEKKFMFFIESVSNGFEPKDRQVHYLMQMLKLYKTKYSTSELSYKDETRIFRKVEEVSSPSPGQEGLVFPEDPEYDKLYQTINWRGRMSKLNNELPALRVFKGKGHYLFYIPPEIIDAAMKDDFEKVKSILSQYKDNLIQKRFVKVD